MKKKAYFTTSWDDGSIYDIKLAELLTRYHTKGTFYLPIKNVERNDSLSSKQLVEIAREFEIGGHTYSHIPLTSITDETSKNEIENGKKALQDIIGEEIVCFCPPQGKFKRKHLKMIENCGFLLCRTVGYLRTTIIIESIFDSKIALMHPTLQVYPHNLINYICSCVKRVDLEGAKYIAKNLHLISNWGNFLYSLLREVEISGGVFHLWGHSWELEEHNLWGRLESLLKHVKESGKFEFINNSEVLKIC